MRIIAGEHKGRKLTAPPDRTTRPTTDRVRESIMSAVISAKGDLADARVLDLFAGSGAMSFEALSRGASFAYLVDNDRMALAAIKSNAEMLGYGTACVKVVRADSFKVAPDSGLFDLVFLDPPYAVEPKMIADLLEKLVEKGVIAHGALVVYEHNPKAELDPYFRESAFRKISQKSHSSCAYDILEVA